MPLDAAAGSPARLFRGREAVWQPAVLALGLLVVCIVVPPNYEVPQNDDWAYLQTLEIWVDTGELVHLGWNDPTLVFQLLWGRLFAAVFGVGYTALRISTLVLAWLGAVAVCGMLRQLNRVPSVCLLAGGLLLFNPIYLTMGYSFNTDVPYVALAALCCWAWLRSLDRGSLGWMAVAGLLGAAAFLIRQQGLAVVVLAAIPLIASGSLGKRRWSAMTLLLVPTALAFIAHAWFLDGVGAGGWSARPTGRGFDDLALQVTREAVGSLVTAGLFVVPLVAALILTAGGLRSTLKRPRGAAIAATTTLVLLAGGFWIARSQSPGLQGWPYQGNYLTRHGSLPAGPGPAIAPDGLFDGAGLLGTLSTALVVLAVVSLFGRSRTEPAAGRGLWLLVIGVAQFAPALLLDTVYDRYLLVALPGLLVALACVVPTFRAARVGLILFALFAVASTEWTRTYVDRARARWGAAEALVATGVGPEQIAAGFEWEAAHLYVEARDRLGIAPPYRLDEGYPWAPLTDHRYRLVERSGPGSGRNRYAAFWTRRDITIDVVPIRRR